MADKKSQTSQANRHDSRILALLVLFQLDQAKSIEGKSPNIEETIANVKEFQEELEIQPDQAYSQKLLHGVLEHQTELDQLIENYLTNWHLDRLNKIDLNILRIASYELNYEIAEQENLAEAIVINEAIELAKEYNDEKSAKFINGVLSNMASDLA